AIWLGLAAAAAAAGLLAAARLHAAGRPVAGWLTCALTGLLVSPISWDHHWVWLAPAFVLLAGPAGRPAAVAPPGLLGRGGPARAGLRRLAQPVAAGRAAGPLGPDLVPA